jgi:hypothetical protein
MYTYTKQNHKSWLRFANSSKNVQDMYHHDHDHDHDHFG